MRYLFFIILFVASIFLGLKIAQDPGYALFVYHGWSVQMPLWIFFLLFLFLFFLIYLLMRFFLAIYFFNYSVKLWRFKRSFHQNEMKNQKK